MFVCPIHSMASPRTKHTSHDIWKPKLEAQGPINTHKRISMDFSITSIAKSICVPSKRARCLIRYESEDPKYKERFMVLIERKCMYEEISYHSKTYSLNPMKNIQVNLHYIMLINAREQVHVLPGRDQGISPIA